MFPVLDVLVALFPLFVSFAVAAPVAELAPARVEAVHPGGQARLRRAPAWRRFVRGEGAGWVARFDEATGVPRRAWGPPLGLGPTRTAAEVVAGLRGLFARNPGLTGVSAAELPLRSARYDARRATWYVDFDRTLGGTPLWRAGVTARVRNGALVMLGVDTHPAASSPPDARPGDVVVAELTGMVPTYRLASIRRRTEASPPGRWTELVDRRTGATLAAYNAVRFLDGTITGVHDVRTVDSGFEASALAWLPLSGSGGSTGTTDAIGAFSVNDTETWTASLRGDLVDVTNEAGAEATLILASGAVEWNDTLATQAELDSYVFQHRARDFGLRFAPDLPILTAGLRAKVNVSVTCYSYYDGAVNFGIEGDGCNNPARIADIQYHEWGHALHEGSVLAGVVDGTVGEGVGDFVAALLTLDPQIAPGFYTDGDVLREIDTDLRWPDDVKNNIYRDSLIFSGAMWDLLGALQVTYGESAEEQGRAWETAAALLAGAIQGGPTLTTAFDELMFVDDDDANLANGTPHLCELVAAFGAHGLGPLHDAFPVLLDHVGVENQALGVDIPIKGEVRSLAPGCLDAGVATLEVTWSTDGGATWESAPLAWADDHFSGAIPAFGAPAAVQYAIVARSASGDELRFPERAWAPFGFYVGELWPLWCEDFSAGEGGFTHELVEGVGAAADDWQFGLPYGESGDPAAAWSGESVWGNDLGEGSNNGNYPYAVRNRLTAPAVPVAGLDAVVVQYRRFLSVDDALMDRATLYADERPIWENGADDGEAPTLDPQWVQHTLAVPTAGDTLTLAWELASDGETSLGGWTIDDVCVYRTTAPEVVDTGDTGPLDTGSPSDTGDTAEPAPAPAPTPDDCGCAGGAGFLPLLALLGLRRRYGQIGASQ